MGYFLKCKICLWEKEERNTQLLLAEEVVINMMKDYTELLHYTSTFTEFIRISWIEWNCF
jgi:tRNA/tmRNA/rRNA uracil-C5-methylase (TrmA/RlmC/RlmD family)